MLRLLITPEATIRDALEAIDRGTAAIALMADDRMRLLGTVSDGDLRRALLAGSQLDDGVAPVATRRPLVVREGTPRAEVLDLMRAQALLQIPVVDDEGRLVGLHLLREMLGREERPNWAVIMAGGRGTRLGVLTEATPKPMLRVAGRPILERLVLHLVGYGVRRIFLSVNYLSEVIEEHFGDGTALGCEIAYLREEGLSLGTGGSLRLLHDGDRRPEHPLLVINGDLVTDFSVPALLESHRHSRASATLAVRPYTHAVPFGVAQTTGSWLTSLLEKPVESWLVNAGIYVLEPGLLERIPAGREFHVPELLQHCLDRGEHVNAWETDDDWEDVGRPEELVRARGRGLTT